jgi:hexosaminidase
MRTLYLTYPNMIGEDVKQFQSLLIQNGFDPGPVDGVYGQKSTDACMSFQYSQYLVVDGICGPQTWAALFAGVKSRIKAGTWNIKRGYGNINAQQAFLESQNAQLMGIQEVISSKNTNNLLDLRTTTMQQTLFAPTINYSNGSQYGIGLMSYYVLGQMQVYQLDYNGYEKRILQKSSITVGKKILSVYNTHFSWETASIRAKQFAQVMQVMNSDTNKYKILFGDFNAKDTEFAVLSDYTVALNRTIDKIIVSKNISVISNMVISTKLSDHNPVFAVLEF